MKVDRKYPNRADKVTSWFLLLALGIAINIGIVIGVVMAIYDLKFEVFFWTAFGVIVGVFLILAILILYKTSPVRYAGRGKKKYDYELDHLQAKYKDFGFIKNVDGIDLLVVSPYGLYAISSCCFEGRLYGMDSDEFWRQSYAFKKQKTKLDNPCKKYLEKLEQFKKKHDIKMGVNPVLVLLSNNKGYINSKVLYAPSELVNLFDNQEEVLSGKEIDSLTKKFTK